MWLCTIGGSVFAFSYLSSYVTFWLMGDFSWYAPQIDSCLDMGGQWHEDLKFCESRPLEYYQCLHEGKDWDYPADRCVEISE